MKNKLISLHVIFTLLLIISGALYLIYIFRNRENFDSGKYSWKYGEGLSCKGDLNTNTELQNINSYFNRLDYEKYSTEKYNKSNIKNPNHLYADYCDIMSYNDLLYPHMDYKATTISPDTFKTLQEKAKERLKESEDLGYIHTVDKSVLERWNMIIDGKIPDGFQLKED